MAKNVGNIKVKLNLDSAAYDYGIKECVNSTKMLSNTLAGLGLGFSAVQIVNGIKNIAANAIKASSEFEQAGVQFGVMLGDAKKAQTLVNEIQDMANVTPFETQDLLDASKTLLNFGINLEEILPDLKMLGDIAGGDKQRMQSLTLAFSQMSSAGRLMGQDLLQMINAGFNPLQVISEKTGKSMAALKDEMGEGKITVNMVRQAFIDATSEGGRFYGMMDKQSQTLEGKLSTLNDAYTIMTRSVADMAVPAIKSGVEEVTNLVNSTNDAIGVMQSWIAQNRVVVGGIKDASVALAVLAAGIPLTNAAVVTLMTSMRNFGVITARTTAYQVAFATLLKGDAKLALLQYRTAIQATIVQIRALTVALLQCPLTWITLALGAGALVWWDYRQSVMETERTIDELNNTTNEQVNKTTEAIRTLRELKDAKDDDYRATQRIKQATKDLEDSLGGLIDKYPNYINKLKEELRLKGEISKATAEQIANEITLQKVKGLKEQRDKVEKIIKNRSIYATYDSIDGTTHFSREDDKTKEYNRINKEIQSAVKEREGIVKELTNLEKETSKYSSASGAYIDKKAAKKAAAEARKAAAEAKRKQKEALDIKIAQLEQQKYLAERSEEEIYRIELKQIQTRLDAAKKGTSDYEQILAQKLKLEQEHAKRVREVELEATIAKSEQERTLIENHLSNIELKYSAFQISRREQLQEEIALIKQKIELEKLALSQQLKFMGNNEAEKIKLRRDSTKVQEQLTQDLTKKNIELKSYELEKFKGFADGIESAFSSSISSMIKGEKSFADACYDMLESLADNFIDQIGKMTYEWINQHVLKMAYNKIFAANTTATNSTIAASNVTVAASNSMTATSSGILSAANTTLSATNSTLAATSSVAATTTATSAGVMTGAASGITAGMSAMIAPVATLATNMATLALSTGAVAGSMSIIALSTGLYALEAALASLTSALLSTSFGALAVTSKLAAKGVAELAIANAANSAAQIPFVGWAIAPGAALTTGGAIMAAGALVQFRENGGPVEAGKAYVVGERRPELFIPDRSGTILPDTSALNGGGDTYNQYSISVSMPVTSTDAKSFEARIDEFTGRIHRNLSKSIKSRKLAPLG